MLRIAVHPRPVVLLFLFLFLLLVAGIVSWAELHGIGSATLVHVGAMHYNTAPDMHYN